jgi:hypothetical protein
MSQDKQRIPVKSEEQDLEKMRFAAALDRALQADDPKEEDIELINKTHEEFWDNPARNVRNTDEPEDPELEDDEDDQRVAHVVNEVEQLGLDGSRLPSDLADLYEEAVPEDKGIAYPEGDLPVPKTSENYLDELLGIREVPPVHRTEEVPELMGSFIEKSRGEGINDEEIADDLLNYAAVSRAEMNYGNDPDQTASRLAMSRPDEALALYKAGMELEDERVVQVAEGLTEKFTGMMPDKYSEDLEEVSLDDLLRQMAKDENPGESYDQDVDYESKVKRVIGFYDSLERDFQDSSQDTDALGWAAARKAMGGV